MRNANQAPPGERVGWVKGKVTAGTAIEHAAPVDQLSKVRLGVMVDWEEGVFFYFNGLKLQAEMICISSGCF